MNPFTATDAACTLKTIYPESSTLRKALPEMSKNELLAFLRLWVSEGIPFAFQHTPIQYEKVRAWLGDRLEVEPRDITVIGSARLGYSLSPHPRFGRAFHAEQSDLDISIIAESCFRQLGECFEKWKYDYQKGLVVPRHATERYYWDDNLQSVPSQLKRGFVDYNKIPFRPQYAYPQFVAQSLYQLKVKISSTNRALSFRKITSRFYNTWQSFFGQQLLNLRRTIRRNK